MVMHRRLQSNWNVSCYHAFRTAIGVVTFAGDGASDLGVRGASARQVVDVSTIENNVFALRYTSRQGSKIPRLRPTQPLWQR